MQRFDDVPSLIAVDLIEAAKEISLSVAADHVTGGQDLEETLAVFALDQILLDAYEVPIGGLISTIFFASSKLIVGLIEIVGQSIALIPAR